MKTRTLPTLQPNNKCPQLSRQTRVSIYLSISEHQQRVELLHKAWLHLKRQKVIRWLMLDTMTKLSLKLQRSLQKQIYKRVIARQSAPQPTLLNLDKIQQPCSSLQSFIWTRIRESNIRGRLQVQASPYTMDKWATKNASTHLTLFHYSSRISIKSLRETVFFQLEVLCNEALRSINSGIRVMATTECQWMMETNLMIKSTCLHRASSWTLKTITTPLTISYWLRVIITFCQVTSMITDSATPRIQANSKMTTWTLLRQKL